MAWGFTRTELIDAVVSGLTSAGTSAGSRVYKARTSSLDGADSTFPAILVWSGQSTDVNILDACTTAAEFSKTWAFTIDMRVKLGGESSDAALDEALDVLEEEVRAVFQGAVTWSSGLDSFKQVESVSAFYDDHVIGGDGKSTRAALTYTVTSERYYG